MSFGEANDFLSELLEFMNLSYLIAEMGVAGVMLMVAVITTIISFLFSVVLFVLEAIPTYALAKKVGRKYAWLAWIPICGSCFRLYVLSDIAGDKELVLWGDKLKIKNRFLSFWIYVGIDLFGDALITAIIGILQFIPVIGQIVGAVTALLYLVPKFAKAVIEYAYLRDVLDIFKEDKKSNNTAAIVVTALDALVTLGFARTVYLYTIIKREPLPEPVVEVYAAPEV